MSDQENTPETKGQEIVKFGGGALTVKSPSVDLVKVQGDYDTAIKTYEGAMGASNAMWALQTALYACSISALSMPPVAIFFGSLGFAMQLFATSMPTYAFNSTAQDRLEEAQKNLKDGFHNAQVENYELQQQKMVEIADAFMAEGGRLVEKDLAFLIHLTPDALEKASDELAITVLQVRKLLVHMRCTEFNADGTKKVSPPITFDALRFDPAFEPHRKIIRDRLMQDDVDLDEDDIEDNIVRLELDDKTNFKIGFWGAVGRSFITPLASWRDIKKHRAYKLPEIPEVPVMKLNPAEDFAKALATYENNADNLPLDLPAMRGWGTAKLLPANKQRRKQQSPPPRKLP